MMKQRPKFRATDLQSAENGNNFKHDHEDIELPNRSHTQPVIETAIQEGDTLQALSIRYHCPVAELKRINNLHRENEIFARRTIKVPYRTFSVAAVHKSGDSSPDANLMKKSVDANSLKEKLTSVSTDLNSVSNLVDLTNSSLLEVNSINDQEISFNKIIFNTSIASKEDSDDAQEVGSDEEVQLLPNIEVVEPVKGEFNCSGADWGMSWPFLLVIILIVAFFGPLIYILYIAEHPEKYHHHR